MRGTWRLRVIMATLVVGTAAIASMAVTDTAGASPGTPFTECPSVGVDTSCGALITINPDGSTSFATDPSQSSYSGHGDILVGVLNDSNALTSAIALTGTGIFAFDGHGLCAVHPTPCFSATEYGPTGYEGPGTAFVTTNTSQGQVNFNGGLSPGTSTYFSLAASSLTVTGATLAPDIDLSVSPVTAEAGASTSPIIATFTDGGSDAALGSFKATISWGDGGTSPGVISQTGGAGSPYQVTGTHTYSLAGGYTTGVTVTDNSLPLNTATANGSATVTDSAVIICTGSGCQGSVTTPTQSLTVTSGSTTGTIEVSLQTFDGSLNCGDPYRHAPQITTIVDSGLTAGSSIDLDITFPKADVTGPSDIPLAVCYSSLTPFTDLEGAQTTLGLLPDCGALRQHPKVGPCISKMSRFPFGPKTLFEKLIIPEGDPRAH